MKLRFCLFMLVFITACSTLPAQQSLATVSPPPTVTPEPANPAPPTQVLTPTATPFVRDFVNVAANDDYLIGAYWYPWYGPGRVHWDGGYLGKPVLGQYTSSDPNVINRQIDWATGHGIDFWAASWWGPGSDEDKTIRAFTGAEFSNEIKFIILYESLGRLDVTSTGNDISVDLSNLANKRKFINDMSYLAKNYFVQPNYLHIDDRPVIFLYLSRIFVGDVAQALSDARATIKKETGKDAFIIGDEVYWGDPIPERLPLFDAVTNYNMHASVPDIAENFNGKVASHYQIWAQAAADAGITFIPDVLPGFDESEVNPSGSAFIIPRSLDLFAEQLKSALALANGPTRIVMITSWNEWHEYTAIEPAEEFGFQYLDLLKKILEEN